MPIYDHIEAFADKPVVNWQPGQPVRDAATTAYRIAADWDAGEDAWSAALGAFLEDPGSRDLTELVIGPWGPVGTGEVDAGVVVEAVVAAREQLPRLDAIFFGDITMEESEISWIEQTDVSPIFNAYPDLQHFAVRGGNGLSLGTLRHDNLRTLIVETGGLPAQVVRQVAAAELPRLEHLELWLGSEDYGGDATLDDLAPILAGDRFPRLRYLGLRDSELADEIAYAVASAPILERIEVLDLSLGTLGDEGAAALLDSPGVKKLRKLDIHHHFCSPGMVAQLEALGIEVDASDPQEADDWDGEEHRYAAVTE